MSKTCVIYEETWRELVNLKHEQQFKSLNETIEMLIDAYYRCYSEQEKLFKPYETRWRRK